MFYNPVNPGAARDNVRQGAVDSTVLLKLIGNTDFATAKRADNTTALLTTSVGRTNPRFDTTHSLLIGHSQGSQTVAPQAALDPLVKGVVLSGSGGDIRAGMIERIKPFEMRIVLAALLGTGATELDQLHPLMSLAQMMADGVDPQTFARFYREPLAGMKHQNVLHFIGTNDTMNPRSSGEALAIAMRGTQLEPSQGLIEGMTMLSLTSTVGPIKGNNGTDATIGFLQLSPLTDGHFLLFDDQKANAVAQKFFSTVKATGVAEIGPY